MWRPARRPAQLITADNSCLALLRRGKCAPNEHHLLKKLGVNKIHSGAFDGTWRKTKGPLHSVVSPVNGKEVGKVRMATPADYAAISKKAHETFLKWRELPAPQRGEYVRRIGNAFRDNKELLGKLVTLEAGKIVQEGLGEAQECIDIADFAVGLSRQLYGLTIQSERDQHHMREMWQPLGSVGIITAFNFLLELVLDLSQLVHVGDLLC